jgi:hypothetical protein
LRTAERPSFVPEAESRSICSAGGSRREEYAMSNNAGWHARVSAAIEARRQQREADENEFDEIYRYLNSARSQRDGEQLYQENGFCTLRYMSEPIFSFSVSNGIIALRGNGEFDFTAREAALAHMADCL